MRETRLDVRDLSWYYHRHRKCRGNTADCERCKLFKVNEWLRKSVINMAPKSEVWRHFVKINGISAKCNYCASDVKNNGNTKNLWNHLTRNHKDIRIPVPSASREKHGAQKRPHSQVGDLETLSENPDDPEEVPAQVPEDDSPRPTKPMRLSSSRSSTDSGGGSSVTAEAAGKICSPPPRTPSSNSKLRASSSSTASNQTLEESFDRARAFSPGGRMTSTLNQALMFMVAKDGLPLNFVEGEGFKHFLNKAVPLYKGPSRKTFTSMMDKKYAVLSERMRSVFSEVEHFNLTADAWTDSHTTQSYLGVTVHYLEENSMESATIGVTPLTESHTSANLSKELKNICSEWNIDVKKVCHVVTDNAANIVKAAKDAFGEETHMGCFAHTLNLVAEKSMSETKDLRPLIDKVKRIVSFFKHNVNAADQLKKLQSLNGRSEGTILKLIQAVPTRWNSTFLMLERAIELSSFIGTVLLNYVHVEMLTGSELATLKEVCRVLKPLFTATCEISAEKTTTISKIIPMMNLMRKMILQMVFPSNAISSGSSYAVAEDLRDQLVKQIDKRYGAMELNQTLAIATILDPRFKKIHFRGALACNEAIEKISQDVSEMLQKKLGYSQAPQRNSPPEAMPSTSSADSVWALHESLVASNEDSGRTNQGEICTELQLYLQAPLSPLSANPLALWKSWETVYPSLYPIAKDFLSRLASSVAAERLFSKAGDIASEKRSRLTGKRLSQLLFLHSLDSEAFFKIK